MSDLLIKGMKLPQEGETIILEIDSEGNIDQQDKYLNCFYHLENVAIEVPPHGDLIERSSVYKVLDDRIDFYKEAGDDDNACNMVCVEGDIVAIPTIIGASKERKK